MWGKRRSGAGQVNCPPPMAAAKPPREFCCVYGTVKRPVHTFGLQQHGHRPFCRLPPSNISRIHSDVRGPRQGSLAITRVANGIYRYADNENLLPTLCQVCEAEEDSRAVLVPALFGWPYDTRETPLPPLLAKPRPGVREQRRAFGSKLSAVMDMLELSNTRLARAVNVDPSLISRFRNGLHSPGETRPSREGLAAFLLERIRQQNLVEELASLRRITPGHLAGVEGLSLFSDWLYENAPEQGATAIDQLLESLDSFSVQPVDLAASPPLPAPEDTPAVYWNEAGLRQAVLRFLSDAARLGGELWLYSDESMDWLTDDVQFKARWAFLMLSCLKAGVKIRVLCNIDGGVGEMVAAIRSWLPLYMSGLIEPYACRKPKDPRFSRTMFLHRGHAGILGAHAAASTGPRWYDYITGPEKLASLECAYQGLVSISESLLTIYTGDMGETLYRLLGKKPPGRMELLLSGPFVATMPPARWCPGRTVPGPGTAASTIPSRSSEARTMTPHSATFQAFDGRRGLDVGDGLRRQGGQRGHHAGGPHPAKVGGRQSYRHREPGRWQRQHGAECEGGGHGRGCRQPHDHRCSHRRQHQGGGLARLCASLPGGSRRPWVEVEKGPAGKGPAIAL